MLLTVVLAQLVVTLDGTVVNIALPSAQRDLGFSGQDRQWIITAYAMAFGGLLLLGGRISELLGRRRALTTSLIGFAAASAVGGAATTFMTLVIARAVQGVFAALLAPTALSLLVATFTEAKPRARAFAAFSAAASGGAALGVLLGGFLTQFLDWRWTLFINVVLCACAIAGCMASVPRRFEAGTRAGLDIAGAVLVTAGLFALVFGLSQAPTEGWGGPLCWGPLLAAATLLAGFGIRQKYAAEPLLPLTIVRDRHRGGAFAVVALLSVGMFGALLFVNYFFQQILMYSPIRTGIAFLPLVGMLVAGAQLASRVLLPLLGARIVVTCGMVVAAGGMGCLALLAHHRAYSTAALPGLLLVGAGIGVTITSCFQSATAGIQPQLTGVASAAINTSQQIGGAVGTALLNTIALGATAKYIQSHGHSGDSTAYSTVHGYIVVYWWGVGTFGLAAVLSGLLFLRHRPHTSDRRAYKT